MLMSQTLHRKRAFTIDLNTTCLGASRPLSAEVNQGCSNALSIHPSMPCAELLKVYSLCLLNVALIRLFVFEIITKLSVFDIGK